MTLLTIPAALEHVLAAVATLGAAVWIGGFVAIMVVNRSTRDVLGSADRIALFRVIGRRYLVLATLAAALVVICGGILLAAAPFDGVTVGILAVVAGIVALTIAGVVQARRMGRLRSAAHELPDNTLLADQVRRGAIQARVLRALIGLASLALYVLAFVRT